MKKSLITTTLSLIISSQSIATTLDEKWESLIALNKLDNKELIHSYCYVNKDGDVSGKNTDKMMSLASVSKVFTTFWALSTYGKNYQFKTKIYINGKNVHIEGGKDPFVDRRKIFMIIKNLNDNGIKEIDKLTYDDNFYFVPNSITNSEYETRYERDNIEYTKYFTPTNKETERKLQSYLNTATWSKDIENELAQDAQNFSDLSATVNLTVKEISSSSQNPFLITSFNLDKLLKNTKEIIIHSAPLSEIVKFINSMSNNLGADLLFYGLGGSEKFNSFLATKLLPQDQGKFSFISGSGLPYNLFNIKENVLVERTKNKASCRVVLQIMQLYSNVANNFNYTFFDGFDLPQTTIDFNIAKTYLPVNGVEGTVRSFKTIDPKSFVAKTGSLWDTKALSGTFSTNSGKRHFAILNELPSAGYQANAILLQKAMIKNMTKSFGNELVFDYNDKMKTSSFSGFRANNTVVNKY